MSTHHNPIMSKESFIAASAAPPAGISGLTLLGVGLPDWVLIITALYTILALFVLVRDKFYRPWRTKCQERQKKPSASSTEQ